LHFVTLAAYSV